MRLVSLSLALASMAMFGCNKGDGEDTDITTEDCTDGTDNDGDGATDCDDSDCDVAAVCDTDIEVPTDDDTFETATAVEITPEGAAFEDDLDDAGDRDFRSFTVAEGSDYWFYSQSATGGEGAPDTVIRIYDENQELLTEDDDLPYRLYGTDSGVYFRALATGTYYVEVLEWSDWAGETPIGATGYDYVLYGAQFDLSEINENQNSDNDTIAQESDNLDGELYSFYRDPWTSVLDDQDQLNYFVAGAITEAGDVDTFGFDVAEDPDAGYVYPTVISFGRLPGQATALDAQLELYDEEGNLVASSGDDIDILPQFLGIEWDAAFTYPIWTEGRVYMQIRDGSGGSGIDHWYGLMGDISSYLPEYITIHDVPAAQEADPVVDAVDTALNVSATDSTVVFSYLMGRLEADGDDWDSFKVSGDDVSSGRILRADFCTMGGGSLLDATVRVLDADGTELYSETTHVTFDSPDDPEVFEFELPSGIGDTVYVVIEGENEARGNGAFYTAFLSVADE